MGFGPFGSRMVDCMAWSPRGSHWGMKKNGMHVHVNDRFQRWDERLQLGLEALHILFELVIHRGRCSSLSPSHHVLETVSNDGLLRLSRGQLWSSRGWSEQLCSSRQPRRSKIRSHLTHESHKWCESLNLRYQRIPHSGRVPTESRRAHQGHAHPCDVV